MSAFIRGSIDGRGLRIAVVASRFNEEIVSGLLEGALQGLREAGVADDAVSVCSVPGAVEIPVAAKVFADSGTVDAVVAVGAVIRGETSHYDYVCRMVADGCQRVALDAGLPVAFGVLTCDTEDQARARAGARDANKGFEAARVAVEMVRCLREIRP